MCNNSTKQKGKKFQLHIIYQSFEHNGVGISYQKMLERREEKEVNPLETIWIIVDETTYKDPGARFSKAPIINGPVKLLLFTGKMEVSIVLQLT